jgi:hypothetical protein
MQQPSDRQPDLAMFSAILLEIYRLAREESLERFHHTVLECLRPQLAFDKAWWGRAAQAADGPHEHSSFLFGLPDHYIDDWKSIRQHDVTVARVHARPDRPWWWTCRPTMHRRNCNGWASVTTLANCCA